VNARAAKARNRARRERLQRILDQAAASTPKLVEVVGQQEVWSRGQVALVVPLLCDAYPPRLKAALDLRRRATLEGRCDCGAERRIVSSSRIVLEHTDECEATDDNLIAIGAECGVPFRRWIA
jgi:hypothetical protein